MKTDINHNKRVWIDGIISTVTFAGAVIAALSAGYLFEWNKNDAGIRTGQIIMLTGSVVATLFVGYRIKMIKESRTHNNELKSRVQSALQITRLIFFVVTIVISSIGFNRNVFDMSIFWIIASAIALVPGVIIPGIRFVISKTGEFTKVAAKASVRNFRDPDYNKATVSELREFAKKIGVKIPAKSKKEDIIRILKTR